MANADGSDSLYSSDGTAAGSVDLDVPANGFSIGSNVVDFAGRAYFIGIETAGGPSSFSLYSTDGTVLGTTQPFLMAEFGFKTDDVWAFENKLIVSGQPTTPANPALYASDNGTDFTAITNGVAAANFATSNGIGYFEGIDQNGNSLGLWRTDGTAAGTHQISDAALGTDIQLSQPVVTTGSRALFTAVDAAFNQSTWSTDGTAAGTEELVVTGQPARANPPGGYVQLGDKVLFDTGSALAVTDGTKAGTTILTNTEPALGEQVGNKVDFGLVNPKTQQQHSSTYFTDGTAAGTYSLEVPGEGAPLGGVAVVGNSLIFGGYNLADQVSLFETDGTVAGTKQLSLPSGVSPDPINPLFLAPLPESSVSGDLTGTLPTPLYAGSETVSGTGGVSGLQLERITQGTYNTPGSVGWVKATVAANGDWTAKLTFDKPGQVAHVYAENGGSATVVDLVNGTPTKSVSPPATLVGMLPSPLYTGVETVSGHSGIPGLRLERITQGTYNTPGSTGWIKASVAANGDWTAALTFDKPGQLAHIYAQNGGTGGVSDLVNGTPMAALAASVSASAAAEMVTKAGSPGAATSMVANTESNGGSVISMLSTYMAPTIILDHVRATSHLVF